MLSFTGGLRVFVALDSCDMRKGFEGLSGMVGTVLGEELKSGALFVFCNRRRTRLKILYWDGTGLWLMTKRLEEGTFSWPKDTEGKRKLVLRPEALAMLTDGVELRGARLRPWYEREEKNGAKV
jgi:transposase